MSIYLDIIWLLNFFLDGMLLMLTQLLAKEAIKKWRILIGAFIASLLVPISIYAPDSFFTSPVGKCLYSFLIIITTFGFHSIHRLIKRLLLFYFVSFSIGGGLIAVYFMMNHAIVITDQGWMTFHSGLGDPISWLFVIIGFPISWYFTKSRMDKHAIEKLRHDQLYSVAITIKNKTYQTIGYLDSGNHLVDPLTKRCVVICDSQFLKQWFTKEDWDHLLHSYSQLNIHDIPEGWESLVHVIPFHGVSGNENILFAIRPTQLTFSNQEKQMTTNHVLIGIQFGKLSKDGKYHCLLHPYLMKDSHAVLTKIE
ncbi:MAG TPA: sigma-E processing peptidase SpoIIGA [Cerasibacillus sp.]|uniref:sigma-E processing peptidase SpoIIGA n=1 Tax=Cerasibacillus sp. TaxID=2498711 RepID=UPI002F42B47F